MKTILLMRHAKSNWENKNQDDWDRPLCKRGKKNAQQMGKLLEDEKMIPDFILTSTAVRTRQTADILMDELKYRGDFYSLKSLYMAEPNTCAQEIQKLPDDLNVLLVIGHNPCLDCILQMVTGKVESLRTAAIACLTVPIDSWKDFRLEPQGELVNLWRPKN